LTYLFLVDSDTLKRTLRGLKEEICFVGHTHTLALVHLDSAGVRKKNPGPGRHDLGDKGPWLINAGSVGQPRDWDSRAKYVIWDPKDRLLEVRFVPYDVRKTAQAIEAVGIPRVYADRLW